MANARGAALRRTTLRRHLRDCAACTAFRDEVAAQRKSLAQILPVAPSAALKAGSLPWIVGGGGGAVAGGVAGGAAAGGGGAIAGGLAGGSAATKILGVVAAVSAVAGGAVAIDLKDGSSGPTAAEGATGALPNPARSRKKSGQWLRNRAVLPGTARSCPGQGTSGETDPAGAPLTLLRRCSSSNPGV